MTSAQMIGFTVVISGAFAWGLICGAMLMGWKNDDK